MLVTRFFLSPNRLIDYSPMSLPSLMLFGRIRTQPPQNDSMNIDDSGLFNDASSSSFTAYPNTPTDISSINEVNSTTNYGADIADSWESAALRFPSLFTNDFISTAVFSLSRESNADSASCRRVSLLGRRSPSLSSVVSRSKNGRGLLSSLLLTPPAGFAIMQGHHSRPATVHAADFESILHHLSH